MTLDKVGQFWRWFTEHAHEFGDTFENEEALTRLDEMVGSLGAFAWEVGPANFFVLSPGGDRALLKETQAIIDAAPDLRGWEFHAAKPAKNWQPRFELTDANGESFNVDATAWRCVLLKYPDGGLEVVVEANNLGPLSEDYRRWAAEILLDGVLGERRRLELVDQITVVNRLSERESTAAFLAVDIDEHIK